MRFLTIISLSILILSCDSEIQRDSDSFLINGKVNYLRDGYIKLLVRDGNKLLTLDSTSVNDDSSFTLKGSVDNPQYAQINFYNKQMEIFPLTNGDITIHADGNRNGGLFEISGTEEITLNNQLSSFVKTKQEQLMEGKQKLTYAMANKNSSEVDKIKADMALVLENQKKYLKNFVDSLGTGNIVAGYAMVNYLNPVEDFEYFDQKAKTIEAKTDPSQFEIRFLSEFNNKRDDLLAAINQAENQKKIDAKLAIGNEMPNISLPDPNGNVLELKDFKGKVVLVDFWAGWCRPCRAENPNLVRAYDKYKNQGFEIFGISLDRNKEQWVQAIKQDNINWPQVSDLKYWDSKVVKEFNITGIPANFLLDREGKIIGKNLRGQALQNKLESVM